MISYPLKPASTDLSSQAVPKLEELLRFLPGYQCFVVPVEHGRGMTQVQGSLGFVLVVIEPMAGRCMSHARCGPCSMPDSSRS